MESFRNASAAASHPLAAALFEVDGVADIFIVPAFLTVTKRPDVEWDLVWPGIVERLERAMPGLSG